MTEYLLLFRNASNPDGYLATPQDMAEDMPKWQAWISSIAKLGKLVHTAPIKYEASQVSRDEVKQGAPHKEANSVLVSGFLICKADSLAEAETWAKDCPILRYPLSSVEVRSIIPFPVN